MPLEIITLLGSTMIAGLLKLWSMSAKAKAEQQKALIERVTVRNKAVSEARKVESKPLVFTRRIIALSAIFAVIVFPLTVAPFFGLEVTHGWTEWQSGFLFFTDGKDVLEWKTATGLVITPLHTHLVSAISGMYFGSSMVENH